jgi:hypothetical protein
MNRPDFLQNTKKKICLICEGFEEYDYINRLLELGVWADVYSFDLANAESNGNISARYQDRYQSDSYDIVLVFCDTDRKPHKDFELIKTKINNIFGTDDAADKVIIFVTPCTMQINLLHFGDVQLRTQNKHKNAVEIQRLTGITQYKASESQRKKLFSLITKENYEEMKKRTVQLSHDYQDVPSSNFYTFAQYFENTDTTWIDRINNTLEQD